ncbi:hypothetical protein [Vibrio sp. M260112]|uniref:hypothetical protein n=1 Tax=Vibrio sp. M260112 TaxID=3020895 RepID=UPI002F40DEA9
MSDIKGTPITKEMWKAIEEELSRGWFLSIRFAYMGYEISVTRVRIDESKTCLQVYIDDFIKGDWISFKDGGIEFSDDAPKCLAEVWGQKSKSKYSPSYKKKLEKIYGKRRFKKEFPDADDKYIFYVPNFSKASVLCRQYKKLKGITLLQAECLAEVEA